MNTLYETPKHTAAIRRTPGIAPGLDNAQANPLKQAIIAIKDLRVEFASRELGSQVKVAVKNLTLSVYAGEVFGFLGPNGAGKTTTMNVLLGFANATSGSAKHLWRLEQILSHLAKLEEEAGNVSLAINYREQVKILMPQRDSVQSRIDELHQKRALPQQPP